MKVRVFFGYTLGDKTFQARHPTQDHKKLGNHFNCNNTLFASMATISPL